jgi:hypothetical protein
MKKTGMKTMPFKDPKVAAVFNAYPQRVRTRLMFLRALIFDIAYKTEGVGVLEETLKWGQPSYLTTESGSGTTIRLDQLAALKGKYEICVHCQTTLVGPFRKQHGDTFTYDANRGLVLDADDDVPLEELSQFIYLALTYHLRKKQAKAVKPSRAKYGRV